MSKLALLQLVLAIAAPVLLASVPAAAAQDRSAIPDKYKWNLKDLYKDEAAVAAAREELQREIPRLSRFKGHLGDSPAALHDALSSILKVEEKLSRLLNYASQSKDEDTRVMPALELMQSAEQLAVKFQATVSFLSPEILAVGPAKIDAFVAKEPKLKPYRHLLDDILRRKPHTLSPEEEEIAAQAGNIAGTGYDMHSIFTNADMPYPEVTLKSGEKARLDAAGYTKYRALPDREDREKVFQAFWTTYQGYTRTLGTSLYAQVKAHLFNKDVHRYKSSLDAALFTYNIPTDVYRQLIADVNANLPTLHRYLRLRQRILGLDKLAYHDIYAPLIGKAEAKFTPEQATELTLAAVAPLGPEYVKVLRRGFEQRWVDWMPTTGKRSGAYSNSTYGVHPYQLQNFNGNYDDVSTLAHEAGHSMHSYLSDTTQPYVTHDYSIFVAEVASTLNENLLINHMLDQAKTDEERLFLLGSWLDTLRGTLFRQTQFAEFELAIHEMAERGETLTGDNLNKLYLELTRRYYGHDKGVCEVPELYAAEWAYIPHFYYNFYVYQYATSLVASTSIARAIRDEASAPKPSTKARDAYLTMLSSGSSKYPMELLKDAGVDMTTSAPFQAAMKEMNQVMDEIEQILDKKK